MAIEVSDLWPQSSGTSSLGAEMTNGGFTGAVSPFAAIHLNSGIFYDINGQSGVIRYNQAALVFEVSVDGGNSFNSLATGPYVTLQQAYNGGDNIVLHGQGNKYKGVLARELPGYPPALKIDTPASQLHYGIAVSGFTTTPLNPNSFSFARLLSNALTISVSGSPAQVANTLFMGFDPDLVGFAQIYTSGNLRVEGNSVTISSNAAGGSTLQTLGGNATVSTFAQNTNINLQSKADINATTFDGSGAMQYRFGPYQSFAIKTSISSTKGPANDGYWPIAHSGNVNEMINKLITGNDGDVFFNNNGTLGSDSLGLTYNDSLNTLGVSGRLSLKYNSPLDLTQQGPPQPSGIAQLQAINLAERPIFGASNSGTNLPYFFQPALFNKFVFMALPSLTTTIGTYGDTLTTVGTVSHTTPNVASGYMVNLASSAIAGSTAVTASESLLFARGGMSGTNTGFFYAARVTLPDAGYDRVRVFAGFTDQSFTTAVGNDNPAGNLCGFQFSTDRGDNTAGGWQFVTMNGVSSKRTPTNISCSGNRIWDMYIYCPPFPNNSAIYWTLHDVSWNRISSGYNVAGMINANNFMRAGLGLANITTGTRNIRFTHLYCEALG